MEQKDIEKINDVVECIGQVYNLKPMARELLKLNIIARVSMYKDIADYIPANLIENQNYLFKPVNGKYSLVDFFLNRLTYNVREYNLNASNIGDKGHYDMYKMELVLMPTASMTKLVRNGLSNRNIKISEEELSKRIRKVFNHEVGHALQTSFTNGFETISPNNESSRDRTNKYLELINLVRKQKNGKYSPYIIQNSELKLGETMLLDTGLSILKNPRRNDSIERRKLREKIGGNATWGMTYDELIEIFNEDESLKVSGCMNSMGTKSLDDGNYKPIFNYDSSNYSITGYAPMLKRIVGKEITFSAMYIDPICFVETLNSRYQDIAEEVFSNKSNIILNITGLLRRIKHDKTPGIANECCLKLDLFIVKCFEKRVDKYLENNSFLDNDMYNTIMGELLEIEKYVTRNKDANKNTQLQHNIVIANTKQKLNSYLQKQKNSQGRS